jgi:osmotically-inducible protein OsmY
MKRKLINLFLALSLGITAVTAVGLAGCAGDRYNRSTGEYIDDTALTSRVKSALGDNAAYKFDDVKVTSFRGTVQLSGFVNTAEQKQRASDVAKGVEGVKKVENNIILKDKTS